VTSISADLHKYGYAGKGASLLLWRHPELIRDQIFVATDFPGGIYASPTMIGTRPGGPIAAAWAATRSLTESGGYLELARAAAETADRLRGGIARIPGLVVLGRAEAPIVAFSGLGAVGVDVFAIADRLEARGWTVDRMHRPNAIHLTVTANHAQIVEPYLADLAACVEEVRTNPNLVKSGTAPMYGMAAKLPVRGLVARNVRKVIAEMYK
jgi:glutamate/tyrosine decarboxylase-like PLP-dependent enzyme